MNKNIYIINGCNLNMLGVRETAIYGQSSLCEIERQCRQLCERQNFTSVFFQSNSEADIITKIQEASEKADAIIINPAAFTHTSIGIRDALLLCSMPIIEVHISNIYAREEFRKNSYVSPIATGVISGFGSEGYLLSLAFLEGLLRK